MGCFLSTSSFPADVCHGFTDVLSLTFMVAFPHCAVFPQSLTIEAFECTDAHTGLELVFLQINLYVQQSPFSNTVHIFLSAWLSSVAAGGGLFWVCFFSFFFSFFFLLMPNDHKISQKQMNTTKNEYRRQFMYFLERKKEAG